MICCEGAMFRGAVMPSAAAPGATLVTRSSGVSHSPQPPADSPAEAQAQVSVVKKLNFHFENTKTGP